VVAAPFVRSYALSLRRAGFRPTTLRQRVHTAAHLGHWLESEGRALHELILPIVMYHGTTPWSEPRSFDALLDVPDRLRPAVDPYLGAPVVLAFASAERRAPRQLRRAR